MAELKQRVEAWEIARGYFFSNRQLLKVENLEYFEELRARSGIKYALEICGESVFKEECYETDTYGYNNYHAVCEESDFKEFMKALGVEGH